MRRKEKEITDKNEIHKILIENYICRLALCENNIPYIIPVMYGFDFKKNIIYIHSSKSGKKIDILKKNPKVCFEIDSNIKIIEKNLACSFSTQYKSIIAFGTIEITKDFEEKNYGLNLIMKQITNKSDWNFESKKIEEIYILKIVIDSITGKKSGI